MGGNLGLVEATLVAALDRLRATLGPLTVAPLYRSLPVSPVPQPPYLNTAALAHTDMEPDAILALAKALEWAAGRRHGVRLGPRPLDVDLLLWGTRTVTAPELTLPHPRLRERRFVLAPLADIAPHLPVPPGGETVADLLARLGLDSAGEIERLDWTVPPPAGTGTGG
ncbi:MAG TPA: 2-amino-4-hydroxy-6-hydroxymethyldihydropteridine diphosphokinase [Thermoanaerobaculia bacterium]|nr:2-amino-4-hydroxy-6-hydroxymethyldihydropteridine diphosphokinase [Thermoanaerobaculia bacterium]